MRRGGSEWCAKCAPSAARNSEVDTPIRGRGVTHKRSRLDRSSCLYDRYKVRPALFTLTSYLRRFANSAAPYASTNVSHMPASPTEPAAIQTARWLLRPISFMESCRRRFGDHFSITFLGFQTPMVMLSDPEAIQALYTDPKHGLPPGRSIALMPVMGPRSVLLLEGKDHLARRKVMLPPFHGERMQAYEPVLREIAEREIESWPVGEPFALHPRMQAVTLELIMRAVFGVSDESRAARLRELLPQLLEATSSVSLQFRVLLSRRFEKTNPLAHVQAIAEQIDEVI